MDQGYDAAYYRGREIKERDMARQASDPAIAAIHNKMAERYADLHFSMARPALRIVARE